MGLLPDRDKSRPVGGEDLIRSGFLDASTFLEQAEMWLQPESYAKFLRFYKLQVFYTFDYIIYTYDIHSGFLFLNNFFGNFFIKTGR